MSLEELENTNLKNMMMIGWKIDVQTYSDEIVYCLNLGNAKDYPDGEYISQIDTPNILEQLRCGKIEIDFNQGKYNGVLKQKIYGAKNEYLGEVKHHFVEGSSLDEVFGTMEQQIKNQCKLKYKLKGE